MRGFTVAGAGLAVAAILGLGVGLGNAQEAKPTYVGDSRCKTCHSKQFSSLQKTRLSKSLEVLKPTTEKENKDLFGIKTKYGVDPARDYTTDAKCLACHTTGYGKDGGYPGKATAENEKAVKAMGSVTCEACHGPASIYLEYKNKKKEAVKKENAAKKEGEPRTETTFTREELARVGLVTPTEETCKACHNKDNPTNGSDKFNWADARKSVHEHVK